MLTEGKLRTFRATDGRDIKLFDGGGKGLYLLVKPSGAKLWRLKYRHEGRERLMSLGTYPETTLKTARAQAIAKRGEVQEGIDPIQKKRDAAERRDEELRSLFGDTAERWFKSKAKGWSDTHKRDIRRILDKELLPALKSKPMADIRPADVRKVIDGIASRGAMTFARDVRLYFRVVWKFHNAHVADHRALPDPSSTIGIDDAPPVKHHAALEPTQTGAFLRAINFSDATPLVRIAMRMLLETTLRTNEMQFGRWDEVDEKARLWRVPAIRMKVRKTGPPHLVPLSTQMLQLLATLRQITGEAELMFPSPVDPEVPLSDGTLLQMLRRMGLAKKMTPHGCRSMFSGWAHEAGFSSDAVQRQQDQAEGNKVKAAYLRSEFLSERTRLMQAWSDHLDAAERDAQAVSLRVVA